MTEETGDIAMPAWPASRWRDAGLMALAMLVADQASKWWILRVLYGFDGEISRASWHPPIDITPFMKLVMVWNRGVSFGIANTAGDWQPVVLTLLALVIVGVLINWLRRTADRWAILAIGAIIGGAIGNIIDRIRFGAVADFFHFYIGDYAWPAFNVADSCIVIGVMILLWRSLVQPSADRQQGAA